MQRSMLVLAAVAVMGHGVAGAAPAWQKKIRVAEPFGLTWGPDRITEPVQFPVGAVRAVTVTVTDAGGAAVPAQLSDVEFWPDGKSVKSAKLAVLVTLQPDQVLELTATLGGKAVKTDLTCRDGRGEIELANGKTGIRLVGGAQKFAAPVAADKLPAPLRAVRLPNGEWIGSGAWQTPMLCTGYTARITERGPVFARARLRYEFEGGKYYAATVELTAGQDLAVFTEEYNLAEGRRFPMSGSDGMQPDVQYGYVYPKFDPPERALLWDWWAQTMAVLPTPDFYTFSFAAGLKPDSADFHGRSQYGNLKQGDGGLLFDKDGRFAYMNAYLQWGDEETLFLGLWNAKAPAQQLAFVALRPSQWQHPDINPHPNATLKQYVQTTCLTFERRKSGEAFMRAPVCLGKRVYGVGGVERKLEPQVLPDRGGPVVTKEAQWGSNLMLRHVRLGRLELDTVRRWVLDYDEVAKYPRLFVPEGDRVRYESRRTRRPMEEVAKELAARTAPTEADKKVVQDAIARMKGMVLHFAQVDKGHMDFGIEEGIYADLAEDALASPACTPEQAREVRKWLAAIAYYAMAPDFVPPREAGFAWGSANMMAQVQCRACRIAALLPNHPDGKGWRRDLAKAVTLYVEDQINAAGATLECPHYGSMAVMMPVMGLAALASCGDIDLTRAEQRLRAAAHHRLSILLPPDVRGGFRPQCTEGDGYYDGEGTLAPMAGFFQKRDPDLARNLAWGVKESNNALGGHSDSNFKLFDVGFEPVPPKLGTENFPGFGFVMRNGFPAADEAFFMAYTGGFSWGHGHNDRGSWVLYAKGAPLMVDFAAMYTPSIRQQWLHPGGLTFNHDETVRPATDDPKNDWWRKSADADLRGLKTAPFTDVEMASDPRSTDELDTFGKVTQFLATPGADYAVMERHLSYLHRIAFGLEASHGKDLFNDGPHEEVWLKKPFTWTRQFLFVKDPTPAGRNYLVIRDDLSGNQELEPSLSLWCLADTVEVKGPTAVYRGQHGVDLHCYIAEPATFTPATRKYGHPCGFGFAQYYQKTFGKPFREDQIQLRIPQQKGGGGYFAVMVPVKAGEPAPTFATVAGGQAVKITFADRVDTVVLRRDTAPLAVDGRNVKSAAAVLRRAADGTVSFQELAPVAL